MNDLIREPKSWEFPEILHEAFQIVDSQKIGDKFHRNTGMSRAIALVNKPDLKKMPWNELQYFADVVTHAFPDSVIQLMINSFVQQPYELNLNITAVGNLAFISNNAVMPKNRKLAKKILTTYFKR